MYTGAELALWGQAGRGWLLERPYLRFGSRSCWVLPDQGKPKSLERVISYSLELACQRGGPSQTTKGLAFFQYVTGCPHQAQLQL